MSIRIIVSVIAILLVSSCSAKSKQNLSSSPAAEVVKSVEQLNKQRTVYFDYNSSALTEEAKTILDEKVVSWLKEDEKVRATVEGHCDERGSDKYNYALGKRRAIAVREYIVSKGVAAKRVKTVSYGKTRPVDNGHDESAWAKNRRAVTVSFERK